MDDLAKCTVAIQEVGNTRSSNGKVLGTGVIVTDDGLILTCFHVVGDIKNRTLKHDCIDVYFPGFKVTRSAQVVNEYSNISMDVAFYKIESGSLPEKTVIPSLGENVIFGHKFASIGFRKSRVFQKLSSSGEIRIKTSFKTQGSTDSPPLIQLYSDEIEPGMSGAPVLDLETNKVVGIISEHWVTSGNIDTKLNFAIPISSIVEKSQSASSMLRQKNPGLIKINEFLRKIGEEHTKKYERIDELYVPPTNYDDIKKALCKDGVLFITGTQEYGKTYTAVRLLWEYFNKGYEPVWFKGAEKKEERSDVRSRFLNVEKYLKPHHVIYFEDPFGKTEYEVNIDEGIIRNIADIIESVGDIEDAYIVITSREEVFKEFKHRIKATIDLKKFQKKLGVKTPSYNYEKRKEMIQKYASVSNNEWYEHEDLRNTVLEVIKDEKKLPTPLNIQQFTHATANKKSLSKDELLEKIDAKSIETAKSFAEEIKIMSEDKVLFLSFPSISWHFPVELVKKNYQQLVRDFKIEEDAWRFDSMLEWFKDDKIDVSYSKISKADLIRFSHPSYWDAIRFAISESGSITKPGKTFSRVLLKLAHKKDFVHDIVYAVFFYFYELPEKVQNLLLKLANNRDAAGGVASAIYSDFDKLHAELRNELLRKVADNEHAAIILSYVVHYEFDKLPEGVRNELLIKLADNKDAASHVAEAIIMNFDKLPRKIQNLLFRIVENKDETFIFHEETIENFYKLPANLLLKFADNQYLADYLGEAITGDFDELSENTRNNLLLKLADNKDLADDAAYIVANNFSKLPAALRNNLLLKLGRNTDAAENVAYAIVANFDEVPEKIQNLLFRILKNKDAAKGAAYAIADYFYEVPEKIQNLLFRIVENKDVAGGVAYGIAANFDKLPEKVKNLLLQLADNKDAGSSVAEATSEYFDKLPASLRNELLLKVADNKCAASEVAYAIAENYHELPEKVKNLLFRFAENKDTAGNVAFAITWKFDTLPESVRNELLLKLADNKDAASHVAEAILRKFDKLPESVRNELLLKLADNKEAVKDLSKLLESQSNNLPQDVRNKLSKEK